MARSLPECCYAEPNTANGAFVVARLILHVLQQIEVGGLNRRLGEPI